VSDYGTPQKNFDEIKYCFAFTENTNYNNIFSNIYGNGEKLYVRTIVCSLSRPTQIPHPIILIETKKNLHRSSQ